MWTDWTKGKRANPENEAYKGCLKALWYPKFHDNTGGFHWNVWYMPREGYRCITEMSHNMDTHSGLTAEEPEATASTPSSLQTKDDSDSWGSLNIGERERKRHSKPTLMPRTPKMLLLKKKLTAVSSQRCQWRRQSRRLVCHPNLNDQNKIYLALWVKIPSKFTYD